MESVIDPYLYRKIAQPDWGGGFLVADWWALTWAGGPSRLPVSPPGYLCKGINVSLIEAGPLFATHPQTVPVPSEGWVMDECEGFVRRG